MESLPLQGSTPRLSRARVAALMLLLATVAWGFGFTWAKTAQETINRQLDLPAEAAAGPVVMLGVRFFTAGALMLLLVRRARSGWTCAGIARALLLGGLLGLGMTVQHLGLGRTTEAITAFLTSLTILFVPLLMTLGLRKPPAPIFWLAVALATLGIWLMTGATPAGFGLGELLGLACAVVFSVHLIAINLLIPRDDPWRMAAGQFLVSGLMMLAMCLFVDRGRDAMRPAVLGGLLWHRDVGLNMLLLLLFPTILSFLVMSIYQPRLDPSRAALIYLMEPIFAAAYAWVARDRSLGWLSLCGASLIVFANLLVELINAQSRHALKDTEMQALTTSHEDGR